MDDPELTFTKAPIVEAVLDIDCDMPSAFKLADVKAKARENFRDRYPQFREIFQELQIEDSVQPNESLTISKIIHAIQFRNKEGNQIVQLRAQGFSFNRLAPYERLRVYLPEIERCWSGFVGIAQPKSINQIRLRYINKISIKLSESAKLNADEYFTIGPHFPRELELGLQSFLHQYVTTDADTLNNAVIVITNQDFQPTTNTVSFLLDISAISSKKELQPDWSIISQEIESLRLLKNRIFIRSLTEKCLNQYR